MTINCRWQLRFVVLVGVPLGVCWLYCAALLRNFFLVEELTLLPDVAPTTIRLKVCVRNKKHPIIHRLEIHLIHFRSFGRLLLLSEFRNPKLCRPLPLNVSLSQKVHISGLFILATFIDVHAAFLLARDVVCVLPMWVPDVDVDLRPSAGWLRIGTRQISLEDIKVRSTCVAR